MRDRFPRDRRLRIAAWTAMAIAWSTAVIARTLGAPAPVSEAATAAPPEAIPTPMTTGTVGAPTTTGAPVPTLPEDGLVVLRYTPIDKPTAEIRRVVVTRPASGGTATASGGAAAPPPPTTTTSSGS